MITEQFVATVTCIHGDAFAPDTYPYTNIFYPLKDFRDNSNYCSLEEEYIHTYIHTYILTYIHIGTSKKYIPALLSGAAAEGDVSFCPTALIKHFSAYLIRM